MTDEEATVLNAAGSLVIELGYLLTALHRDKAPCPICRWRVTEGPALAAHDPKMPCGRVKVLAEQLTAANQKWLKSTGAIR